jgi:hypothetical protein
VIVQVAVWVPSSTEVIHVNASSRRLSSHTVSDQKPGPWVVTVMLTSQRSRETDSILPLDTGRTTGGRSAVVTTAACTLTDDASLDGAALGEPDSVGEVEGPEAAGDVGPADGDAVSVGVEGSLAAGVVTSDAGADTGGAGG